MLLRDNGDIMFLGIPIFFSILIMKDDSVLEVESVMALNRCTQENTGDSSCGSTVWRCDTSLLS